MKYIETKHHVNMTVLTNMLNFFFYKLPTAALKTLKISNINFMLKSGHCLRMYLYINE